MAEALEVCGASMGVGAAAGGLTGLAIGIWVMVDFVQPALASTSLTPGQASGITAAIALLGGLEGFVGAGVCAGAIAAPIAAAAAGVVVVAATGLVTAGEALSSVCRNAYNRASFFSRNNDVNPPSQNNEPAIICKV